MNNKLLFWAITCSLAGFIFDFHLMVPETKGISLEEMEEKLETK
jgi:hypothetical protein